MAEKKYTIISLRYVQQEATAVADPHDPSQTSGAIAQLFHIFEMPVLATDCNPRQWGSEPFKSQNSRQL